MNAGNRRNRLAARIAAAFIAIGLGLGATSVSAREETLSWQHDSYQAQEVTAFEALIGSAIGSATRVEDLGLPQPDASGVFSATVTVPDADTVYIALRAVGPTGLRSSPSSWQERVGSGGSADGGSGDTGGNDTTTVDLQAGVPLVPHPDALLSFDFAGDDLSSWIQTGAANSLVEQTGLFAVTSVEGDDGLSTTSSEQNIHAHFTGGEPELSNVTLYGRMAVDTSTAGVGVTAYSQYPDADAYYRLRTMGQGETFELAAHPHASLTCANSSTGELAQPGVWYEFELTVESRASDNRVTARVWRQGDARPATPQAECIDSRSGRPTSGKIGVWSMGAGGHFWDDLQVLPVGSVPGGGTDEPLEPPILLDVVPAS